MAQNWDTISSRSVGLGSMADSERGVLTNVNFRDWNGCLVVSSGFNEDSRKGRIGKREKKKCS